jgi:murein DD-endopeptidase MepM/ murein hydrolase activator NlpD
MLLSNRLNGASSLAANCARRRGPVKPEQGLGEQGEGAIMRRIGSLTGLLAIFWLGATAAAEDLQLEGRLVQGGLVLGQTLPGTRVELDDRELRVGRDGRFVIGFGRDAERLAELEARLPDGRIMRRTLAIEQRDYLVQRIDGLPPRQVAPSEQDLARIRADAERIGRARRRDSDLGGFGETAVWPVPGPVSGVFGSQRILNGEPRSPHRGVDVAAPAGTPVGAMASGVVSLAETGMFFTGGTVMVDHGHGVHSVYAHLAEVRVREGQRLGQGDVLGTVGATGRATGAHLHWGVYWFDEAVDPALLVGPMPTQ